MARPRECAIVHARSTKLTSVSTNVRSDERIGRSAYRIADVVRFIRRDSRAHRRARRGEATRLQHAARQAKRRSHRGRNKSHRANVELHRTAHRPEFVLIRPDCRLNATGRRSEVMRRLASANATQMSVITTPTPRIATQLSDNDRVRSTILMVLKAIVMTRSSTGTAMGPSLARVLQVSSNANQAARELESGARSEYRSGQPSEVSRRRQRLSRTSVAAMTKCPRHCLRKLCNKSKRPFSDQIRNGRDGFRSP